MTDKATRISISCRPKSPVAKLPKVFGVSRDAESPGGKAVLVTFHRALTDDELRAFHNSLSCAAPVAQQSEAGDVWWALIDKGSKRILETCATKDEAARTARLAQLDSSAVEVRPLIYADKAAAQPTEAAAPTAAAEDELKTALTVFDMGLSFALCHRDFGATREAVKKLQKDFAAICSMIAERSET